MNSKTCILMVDHDARATEQLADYLARFNLLVHTAQDVPGMRRQLAEHSIDLVVLDHLLPGTEGLAVLAEVRVRARLPLIILSEPTSIIDRIMALEGGADDFIEKPCEPRELVARIHAVLRRSGSGAAAMNSKTSGDVVCFDGWVLYRDDRKLVSPAGQVALLSNAEFRLLSTFLQTPRRLFSRDQLMAQARGRAMDAFDRSIDLLISRLRHKLAQDGEDSSLIKTCLLYTSRCV
ncbi:MAG: DNA-binding response regulator [Ideonella sp. MAG2]|nr:MAG: DNA-binding response regulator [Ideonella sp. MAG2]